VSEKFGLRGKTAIVTGGARGIGLGCSQALAKRGARVVVVDLDQEACDAAAAQVSPDSFGIAADVTDLGAMQQLVAKVASDCGGVDVVIANAGIAQTGVTVRAMSNEMAERVLAVNLNGVYNTAIAALPQIAERRGHIVVTASVYAFVNGAGQAPYAMAKAGVEQLGRALRVELAPHGAGASVAYFGFIDTATVQQLLDGDKSADQLKELVPKFLLKRLTPTQAGETVARGIEKRAPRIITPRRWAVYSTMRGILNPMIDSWMVKDAEAQAMIHELDSRADAEQTTSA
jgi:NAD(P)-dependent dehydrogenase (short-subunit alcohol dehydrogenase family)